MYLAGTTIADSGLGKSGDCTEDASLTGQFCWFDSASSKSVTAVFVPATAKGTEPVTVVVWIHGDIIPCGDEGKNAVSYIKSREFPLARQITDGKNPFVLAAPTMNWNFGNNKNVHALGSPKRMNAFVEEVRIGLTNAGWAKAPALGRLILAGHSRAYVVLNALAAAVDKPESSSGALAKLTDVWLIDTTYGKRNLKFHCNNWITWAKAHAKAPSFINLRVMYRKGTDTSAVAECILSEAAKASLPNVRGRGVASHCSLPREELPALLAASVPVAKSSRAMRGL